MSRMVSALVAGLLLFSVLATVSLPGPAMADVYAVWGVKDVSFTEVSPALQYAGGYLEGWISYDTTDGQLSAWYIEASVSHALIPQPGAIVTSVPQSIIFNGNASNNGGNITPATGGNAWTVSFESEAYAGATVVEIDSLVLNVGLGLIGPPPLDGPLRTRTRQSRYQASPPPCRSAPSLRPS